MPLNPYSTPEIFYSLIVLFSPNLIPPALPQSKIVRVLNLWQKNGVFKIEVIQPLLDMATGSGSATGVSDGDQAGPNGGKGFADVS